MNLQEVYLMILLITNIVYECNSSIFLVYLQVILKEEWILARILSTYIGCKVNRFMLFCKSNSNKGSIRLCYSWNLMIDFQNVFIAISS